MAESVNLTESLNELEKIVAWFDEQDEVDVEQGLTKVKAAATLIKDSKARLTEIENEFEAIEKEMNDGDDIPNINDESEVINPSEGTNDNPIDLDQIPF